MMRTRPSGTTTFAAAIVLGIEGAPSPEEREVAVQRLGRSIRSWDRLVAIGDDTVAVLCATITSAREIDAIAARLADVLRAPMAVGDDVRTFGVCVGSAALAEGEEPEAAIQRAGSAMEQMRAARAGLLAPAVPAQRGSVLLPG